MKRGGFLRDRKGMHTVVGAIFFVLIVLSFATGIFLWTLTQHISYNQTVLESNRIDQERFSESIRVENSSYMILTGDRVQVNATLTNEGSVATQMVNLWVYDVTLKKYGFNDTIDSVLSLSLKPGEAKRVTIIVVIPEASINDVFNSWLVTARGNLMAFQEEQREIIVAQIAQGIGALALDFDNFRYFTYESPQKLANYPNGTVSFDVPKGEYVAFGCYLTNFDAEKRTIVIDSHSLFFQPGRSGVNEGAWFIVNVDINGTVSDTYEPISIRYGETKMLVFASKFDLEIGSFDRLRTANTVTTVATFLLLHGTIGSNAFAQNIPFVSLFYN